MFTPLTQPYKGLWPDSSAALVGFGCMHRWTADMSDRSLIRRISSCFLQLLLLFVLLAGHALADTRKAVVNPEPEYPEIARRMKITGNVKVEIIVAPDGSIKSTKVLGGHPVLADAVTKALKKWKYAPAAAETTIQVDFKF